MLKIITFCIQKLVTVNKKTIIFCALILFCSYGFANENIFQLGRKLQREGKYDEAIETYRNCLSQPLGEDEVTKEQVLIASDALVQLMNTFQSKGEPDTCISALEEVFDSSPILQKQCLRDYYSVKGYALSRTERMKEAEETMIKAFTMPLQHATPERYFRDYAYAAAVFYSNPAYQKDVIYWCQEALTQAQLSKNTSGQQWVTAMLGSLYKRNGNLNEALELFQQSKEEALQRNDDLGVLNSLHTLTDLFLYYDIPEYANIYASEAVQVEKNMTAQNPMVSAQTYINKGRVLYQLEELDSIPFYVDQAQKLCQSLPYNSGMVDVDLLHGIFLTEKGGDSLSVGIRNLQEVARQGTVANRAKAYHQLAQTYLKHEMNSKAEMMLDSLYMLVNLNDLPVYIHLDYEPVLNHYLATDNHEKVEQYVQLMLQEQQIFKARKLNYNLVEDIVDLQTGKTMQELKIMRLKQTNHRLWLLVCIIISVIVVSATFALLYYQKRRHVIQMRKADEKITLLVHKLNESNVEKTAIAQEIKDFLKDKANRQELETLTPFILKENGETKFRQCFELLYPLFLHRLREKVPSITRREELLSMLIVLKQDNKKIAEILAIAPRSVLMLRHRFRQKIGMTTEYSLENFIEDTLGQNDSSNDKEAL